MVVARHDDRVAEVADPPAAAAVRFEGAKGRWILLATVLGSGVAMLDATVVNLALPRMGEDLDAGVAGLQWILNGYLLALASLILLGGSLGDRYGRRRVFLVGVVWFAAASLLCGIAPSTELLVAARVLQGVGGALLTPGSLAIIQASFVPADRGRAIGAWSALGGIATAVGPFLGGYLVDAASWRWIFLLNLPVAAVVVLVTLAHVPETSDPSMAEGLDVTGAVLGAAGLAGVTYALVEGPEAGWTSVTILGAAAVGILGLVTFVLNEQRSSHPMLPLDMFASVQFTSANAVTFAVYGALGGALFLLGLQLQQVVGYTPLAAGAAFFPVTIIMLALSQRAGALATRIGPRLPMTVGPIVAGLGLALMTRIDEGGTYLGDVLPAVGVFGLGLALTVAPLTTAVLAAADDRHAGIASGVNNAVARVAGLLAISVLPVAAGITGADYRDADAFARGFDRGVTMAAVLSVLGGLLAWATIRGGGLAGGTDASPQAHDAHCGIGAPPLQETARPARGSS